MNRPPAWILFALLGCAANTAAPPRPAPSAEPSQHEAPTTVRGRILGHAGTPLRAAHARLTTAAGVEPVAIPIGADGTFSIETDGRGIGELSVTGTDHAATRLLVVLDGTPVDVAIRLGTHPRPEPLADLTMMWWAGDPEATPPEVVPLTKQSDGTWRARATTKAETVRYQIGGTTGPGRVVNGPTGDRWEEDGGGDYRSVVKVAGGGFDVVVDPAKLPPAGAAPTVEWTDPDSPSSRSWQALALARSEHAALEQAFDAAAMTDPTAATKLASAHDWSAPRRAALAALEHEKHADVRHAIIGEYFRMGQHDPEHAEARDRELAAELLGDMPASDGGWAVFASSMVTAVELSGDPRHRARYDALLDEELPPDIAAEFLFAELLDARADDDLESARALYKRLQRPDRFGETVLAQVAKQHDPDGALGPGKMLPSFAVAALRGAKGKRARGKTTVRDADLRGKVYLIDLWATWCVPCIAEMDGLHAAFEKYGRRKGETTRRFGILSISLDEDPSEVTAFRRKFPMPWDHGHLAFDGAMETFGVMQIPFAILVDERGKILASGTALSGEHLDTLLGKHLAAG